MIPARHLIRKQLNSGLDWLQGLSLRMAGERADRLQRSIYNRLGSGHWQLIDCGEMTPNAERFGARAVPVEDFINRIIRAMSVQHEREEAE